MKSVFGSAGVVLAEVVVAIGAVAAGVWVMGRLLDRQAARERDEIAHPEADEQADLILRR